MSDRGFRRTQMLVFSIHELLDEQKCHDLLLEILHPGGLCCPQCRRPVSESKVHRWDRAPLLYYRCSCGRIYNAFARTIFEGTHRRCSQLVAFIQGVVQGKPTAHLARELHAGRGSLFGTAPPSSTKRLGRLLYPAAPRRGYRMR
jgi:hypothetical protein